MLNDFQRSAPPILSSIQGVSHMYTFLTNEGTEAEPFIFIQDQKARTRSTHIAQVMKFPCVTQDSFNIYLAKKINDKLTGCYLYSHYIILIVLYYDTLFTQIIDIYMAIRNNCLRSFNKRWKRL